MTYASPLLTDVFGMSVSSVTVVDAIKNNAIGLIAPLIAGSLASKFGAVRSYFVWLALYVIAVVAVIVTPWAPALVAVVVLSVVLLSFSVKGRSAISNTVLTNAKTPMALFGTSVCIQSVFMTIPDTFCYNIAGNMHLYAVLMGVFYAFFQVFLAEIRSSGAHTELLARKIHRVRSVINGGAKPRKVTCGAQKLRSFIYRQSSCSPF